jgi:heme/copper-type cytochrome/quinol oxidase subunit 2
VSAQRIAGLVTLVSGAALVLAIAAASVTGPSALGSASMMNVAMGSTMMTGVMGATMTGAGHMGTDQMDGSHMSGMMGFASSGPAATPMPGAREFRLQTTNFRFTPSEIRLPKDTAVNLTLENPASSGVVHDLSAPALGIRIAANAGETRTMGVRGLPAGRYDAYCSVPGHAEAGMRATLIVE